VGEKNIYLIKMEEIKFLIRNLSGDGKKNILTLELESKKDIIFLKFNDSNTLGHLTVNI